MKLNHKTVLLTGATGGLGHAIARRLKTAGAELVVTGRRADVLDALSDELGARAIAADLSQPEEVARAIHEAGPIDIFVANAGLQASGHISELTVADVDGAIAVNLRAPIAMAHGLVPGMRQRGSGHIVFIGSIGGMASAPTTAIYNATKFGLRGFALGLRQDLYKSGVDVSIVEPAFVREAGMFAESGVSLPRGIRTSTPRQVARAVTFAIERNRAETIVGPIETRLAVILGGIAPELSARVQRMLGMSLEPAGTDERDVSPHKGAAQ